MITAFRKIYALGSTYAPVEKYLDSIVYITEKIDGSQFGFRRIDEETVECRSKGAVLSLSNPGNMFKGAVDAVLARKDRIPIGPSFYGEVVAKLRHNVLTYGRVPEGYLVLWACDDPDIELEEASTLMGFECVKEVRVLTPPSLPELEEDLAARLEAPSMLGGPVEGYILRTAVGEYAKFVAASFHETRGSKEQKIGKPKDGRLLGHSLATEARYAKAAQRLRENGTLTNTPKDIGAIIAEVRRDIYEECALEIEAAHKALDKEITQGATNGVATWYKQQLGYVTVGKNND